MIDTNAMTFPFVCRYEEIFKTWNMPHKPVRVFTYLIGREISDLKAANWMACQNRGTLAREIERDTQKDNMALQTRKHYIKHHSKTYNSNHLFFARCTNFYYRHYCYYHHIICTNIIDTYIIIFKTTCFMF
jgi:hypothetical protein